MTGWEQVAATGGPWALVAFMVVAIVTGFMRGHIYPRSTVLALEERVKTWEKVAVEAMRQNSRLVPAAEVAVAIADSLPTGTTGSAP